MNLLTKITTALEILYKNPQLFLKFLNYRIKRLNKKWQTAFSGIRVIDLNQIKFPVDFDFLGNQLYAKQMYFKCYELHVIEVIKKLLKPGGTFIDVGANFGYISAYAASVLGPFGTVISFEPVPHIFKHLHQLQELNPQFNFVFVNKAITIHDQPVVINCTPANHLGGNSLVSDFLKMNNVDIEQKIMVESTRLDEYILEKNISEISLIKIDVEGFEFSVLQSLEKYIQNPKTRPPIICEIAPRALQLFNCDITNVLAYMKQFGYQAFDIYNLKKKFNPSSTSETFDVLFMAN